MLYIYYTFAKCHNINSLISLKYVLYYQIIRVIILTYFFH